MGKYDFHGFVYVLTEQGNTGLYKVGYANRHPAERYKEYQAGNPRELVEVAVFPFLTEDTQKVEAAIHRLLKAHEVRREWFKLTPGELQRLLTRLNRTMQSAWKRYSADDNYKPYIVWDANYKYGTLPVPPWMRVKESV